MINWRSFIFCIPETNGINGLTAAQCCERVPPEQVELGVELAVAGHNVLILVLAQLSGHGLEHSHPPIKIWARARHWRLFFNFQKPLAEIMTKTLQSLCSMYENNEILLAKKMVSTFIGP